MSNFNADQVRRAAVVAGAAGVPIAANQIMFNLLDYNSPALRACVTACRELGITVVAYAPLGQGLLCDNLTDDKFAKVRLRQMTGVKRGDLEPLRSTIKG